MRTLMLIAAIPALLALCACNTSESRVSDGTAGEAYDHISHIRTLYVLPAELPDDIHGNATEEEKERWQEDWPMMAARLIARGATDETDDRFTALVSEEETDRDYYFELEITYLDVGDEDVRAGDILDSDEEGWSHVLATGRIIHAESGDLVSELKFEQSTGRQSDSPFENDMINLGQKLGRWIEDRQ